MKVKRKKKNKLIALLVIIVFVFAAVLLFNNISKKYYSSVQSAVKKSAEDEDIAVQAYETEGPTDACEEAMESFGISIVIHPKELDQEVGDDFQDKNKDYDISCVPDKGWFKTAGISENYIPLHITGADINTYNCMDDNPNSHPKKFTRSGKGLTITNGRAFKDGDGGTCPAGSVKMTYKDLTELGGDSNPAVDGETDQAKDPTTGETIYINGSVDLPEIKDEGTESTYEEDDENAIVEGIDVAPDKVDYEIVKNLGTIGTRSKTFSDFETEYKNAKNKIYVKANEDKTLPSGYKNDLKCNFKLDRNDINQIETYNRQSLLDSKGDITNYYYDADNTTYYKGYWEKISDISVQYVYHNYARTDGGKTTFNKVTKKFQCKKTCTEYVKVEYGPPIQVGGGMCFEYRVKVSSVVNCTAQKIGDAGKPSKGKYCSLVPHCSGGHHQAGPTDDFDDCVAKCDKGKYSKYCSDKCYKEVYENTNSLDLVENSVFSDMEGTPRIENFVYNAKSGNQIIERDISGCIRGQHYWNKDTDKYDWCPAEKRSRAYITNNGHGKNSTQAAVRTGLLGIWYYIQKYKTHWYNSKYSSDANGQGIIRAQYKRGQCRENCWWSPSSKCKSGYYYAFNNKISNHDAGNSQCSTMYSYSYNKTTKKLGDTPIKVKVCDQRDLIKYDYYNNMKKYITDIQGKCVGKASCTTSTATFTISFKYKKANATKVTRVDFPYSTKEDKLNSQKEGKPGYGKPGTLIRFGGCYVNADNKKWYLAEWTFPGTWLSNKSGDPVYGIPTNQNQYVFAKGKVCVPYGLANTNSDWAEYYISVQPKDKTVDLSKWKFTDSDYSSDTQNGYNIQAKTTSFGYFHWNIKINCFYALTRDGCGDDKECKEQKCVSGSNNCSAEDFIIRSFDTKDPFLQTAQSSSRIQYKVNRPIGFNWTKDATLTYFTYDGYNVNPEDVLKDIISKEDTYSIENLDYKVHLDAKALQEIRDLNKGENNYTSLLSKESKENMYSRGNGVSHYHSPLLKKYSTDSLNECNSKNSCNIK